MDEYYYEPNEEEYELERSRDEEVAALMAQEEYECRKYDVACIECKAEGHGTQPFLKDQGWKLVAGGEFCPQH